MTTINNLTIEQMREIVRGAPEWAIWWCVEKKKFLDFIPCSKCLVVEDLRTAISEHDTTQLCIGCGSPDLHKGGEIKEPKMCLDCFAEMVGFTRTSNGFIESDEVTDIRNHVSPSTVVTDLHVNKTNKLNQLG